tara:strand:+ start:22 stop:519 length:498 start_codon:yes stop_codon:yes gene_type:complete
MSQLKVNSIIPVAGVPTGGGGGIVQIKQTFKNDATSTTSNTFSDLTGMSATITPTSNSSKILIRYSLYLSFQVPVVLINLVRGSTNIAQPAASPAHFSTSMHWVNTDAMVYHNYEFLDSPATTSATTYKLQWRNHVTGYTTKLNQYHGSANYDATSTMTLMEVSA